MRRAVFDSTILVSAFISRRGGLSHELLDLARKGEFELVISTAILLETFRTLIDNAELRRQYRYSEDRAYRYCRGLHRIAAQVWLGTSPRSGIVRDPADDHVVACAIDARADTIVSRDKDLLSLGSYRAISIITPEAFRQQLRDEQ